ncbi:hypothetical protein BKA70DRAFT_1025941, partial [Coprinopsis sp. MPI-PUGE-AT-0042]
RTLGLDPCGFCGRDSNVAGCLTQLQKEKKGGMTVVSTCPYKHETLKYKAAQNFDREAAPCTNLPIHCHLCPTSASG